MKKRTIEVFVAGCPVCDESVKLVKAIACPSCDVQILNVRTDNVAQAKASQYGVNRVPTIVVDGKIAGCDQQGGIDENTLRSLGVGVGL
jgi:glutaredoxin 3